LVEAKRIREIEARRRQEELWKLFEEIRKEDERVKELEGWVTSLSRATEIREFVIALEALWSSKGGRLRIQPTSPATELDATAG